MHRAAWVLQILLAIYFVITGIIHFVVPEGLPAQIGWMYDLPTTVHWIAGIAEIAGGLVLVMASAAGWHATRGESQNIVGNVVVAALLIFVAYVRTRVHPIEAADHAATI